MLDVWVVSGDEKYQLRMPAVPSVGDFVQAPNFDWKLMKVRAVEWGPSVEGDPYRGWKPEVVLDLSAERLERR